jgi:hypothetical protein
MARTAQGDQVCLRIITKGAPETEMVNLEILQRSASPAAPAVALQDFLPERRVQFPVEA